LEERLYTTVSAFTSDILVSLSSVIGFAAITDPRNAHNELNGVSHSSLTPEQKELKKLAKRIIKAIQGPLDDATRKERDLAGKQQFEKDESNLEALLDQSLHRQQVLAAANAEAAAAKGAHHNGEENAATDEGIDTTGDTVMVNGINGHARTPEAQADEDADADGEADVEAEGMTDDEEADAEEADNEAIRLQVEGEALNVADSDAHLERAASNSAGGDVPALSHSGSTHPSTANPEPLTPPRSEKDLLAPLSYGGIPWYMEPFDPDGTTIHEERWSGRDVLRDLSEELSEIGEAELDELADQDEQMSIEKAVPEVAQKSVKKKKSTRWRGYR
jgi:NuA3 HAT complex component NTO1